MDVSQRPLFRGNLHSDYDVILVNRLGTIDKVIYLKSVRQAGVEFEISAKGSKFDGKLDNNIYRAKSKILEYSLCNSWDYFVTLTIDKSKYDRYDLEKYRLDLSKWINNLNRRASIRYLFVPEFHKDGAVHMHGLVSGIPSSDIVINEFGYSDWVPYHNKFGFISMEKVKDPVAVSFYITKYITKDLASAVSTCGKHLYFSSKGLNKAVSIFKASGAELTISPDYETDYCKVKVLDNTKADYHQFIGYEKLIFDSFPEY